MVDLSRFICFGIQQASHRLEFAQVDRENLGHVRVLLLKRENVGLTTKVLLTLELGSGTRLAWILFEVDETRRNPNVCCEIPRPTPSILLPLLHRQRLQWIASCGSWSRILCPPD